MERKEVLEILFKELMEKVPERTECIKEYMTEYELANIYDNLFRTIDYDTVLNYIKLHPGEGLKLRDEEIPDQLNFKLIFWVVYGGRIINDIWIWNDRNIWDMSDAATVSKWRKFNKLLELPSNGMITCIRRCAFLRRVAEINHFVDLLKETHF